MEQNRQSADINIVSEGSDDTLTNAQLPEWHPFAVWQTQIRNEQTSRTGTHAVLRSVNSVKV